MPSTDGIPAALLLTGGASRRLGRDKATLVVGGLRLVDRAARVLGQVADPVLEVGPGWAGLPCTREEPPGYGPLAALAAGAMALTEMDHPGPALVLAVDMPLVKVELLELLATHPSTECVVPVDHAGYPQTLCARYSRAALDAAAGLAGAGPASLRSLLEIVEVTWLAPSEWLVPGVPEDVFADIDTEADLARLVSVTAQENA